MTDPLVLMLAALYVGVLFAVAYYGGERAARGRSLVGNPYIYALSLAVYCTAWTFYGSVGRAATSGVGFLPIYLGPTLMAILGWVVLRKIVRISKYHRITSVADFIGSRYGKSARLAGVATLVAVFGVVPYIALQLKAIASSYTTLVAYPASPPTSAAGPDTAFWTALALAAFSILFGTRHLDVTERHEGLVAAVAFESVVKLIAFVAVGGFVTFGLYDGFGDLFAAGAAVPAVRELFVMDTSAGAYGDWFWLTGLSMLAVLFLPRQFQVAVVENVDERHLRTAAWLFPLYLLVINLFVLPIAVAGLLAFGSAAQADVFVLTLPLAAGNEGLALLAFLGGFSAATSMVMVAATALSTMICNDVVVPILLRIPALNLARRTRLPGLLLGIRRVSIVGLLLLSYAYLETVGAGYSLVSIGLISFAAVAQFGPALLGGIYWKGGTRQGAFAGLIAGFLVWGYTLPLPSLVEAGWLPASFISEGPLGLSLLKPYALLGLDAFSQIPHALFWSLLVNAGLYAGVSIATKPSILERSQAVLFVDAFRYAAGPGRPAWRGTAQVGDLQTVLRRYLGARRADRALAEYARTSDEAPTDVLQGTADADLVHYAETLLAGAIGSSSARVVLASVVQETPVPLREVMEILDEAQQVIAYSRELEHKKAALEQATRDLKAANEQLKEVDRMKDDFVSTVTHELRTPLTAIRAITEILQANPALDEPQRQEFLETITRECGRLTRLVNQVLDLQRLDAEPLPEGETVDLADTVTDAVAAIRQRIEQDGACVDVRLPDGTLPVAGDRDRIMQVLLNLLSNAAKFCHTRVQVRGRRTGEHVEVAVADDGPGIALAEQDAIFEKFRQAQDSSAGPQPGSGLGLAIAQQIIHQHGGDLWVESTPGEGALFAFRLPHAASDVPAPTMPTPDGPTTSPRPSDSASIS